MCKLSDLRKQIDEIDEQLAMLLKRRFSVAKQIGEYKKANGIVVTDSGRESAVYEHIGGLFNFSPTFLPIFFRLIKLKARSLKTKIKDLFSNRVRPPKAEFRRLI